MEKIMEVIKRYVEQGKHSRRELEVIKVNGRLVLLLSEK